MIGIIFRYKLIYVVGRYRKYKMILTGIYRYLL